MAGMLAGQTGIREVRRFSTDAFHASRAGLVPGWDEPPLQALGDGDRCQELALAFAVDAASEALDAAGVTERSRVALVLGTGVEDRPRSYDQLAAELARRLHLGGPCLVVSIACASATAAIGVAAELIRNGDADTVVAGGSDVISPRVMAGFHVLGALSDDVCTPFSNELGMSVGDGAAFVVLERDPAPARAEAWLNGEGLGSDAWHSTQPAPDGHGVATALASAMSQAGVQAIDYVNAHGTGTHANDSAETRGIASAAGAEVPISSTKGLLGHAQGAAGALELAVTLLARRQQAIPPTWGFRAPRPGAPSDPVAGTTPRPGPCATVGSCNSAFFGANAALVVGSTPGTPPARTPIWVHSTAVVPRDEARFRALLPKMDPRGADPSIQAAAAAVRAALLASDIRLGRSLRPGTGLVVGQPSVSRFSVGELMRSIQERGLGALYAAAFARSLLVAPAGSTAMYLGMGGPLDAVSAGTASGFVALVHAASQLCERSQVHTMFAASADEGGPWEGGAAVMLRSVPGPVRLAGWALAGPERIHEARDRALARAGLPPTAIDRIVGPSQAQGAGSTALLDLHGAMAQLRERACRAVLLLAHQPGCLCGAAVLIHEEE